MEKKDNGPISVLKSANRVVGKLTGYRAREKEKGYEVSPSDEEIAKQQEVKEAIKEAKGEVIDLGVQGSLGVLLNEVLTASLRSSEIEPGIARLQGFVREGIGSGEVAGTELDGALVALVEGYAKQLSAGSRYIAFAHAIVRAGHRLPQEASDKLVSVAEAAAERAMNYDAWLTPTERKYAIQALALMDGATTDKIREPLVAYITGKHPDMAIALEMGVDSEVAFANIAEYVSAVEAKLRNRKYKPPVDYRTEHEYDKAGQEKYVMDNIRNLWSNAFEDVRPGSFKVTAKMRQRSAIGVGIALAQLGRERSKDEKYGAERDGKQAGLKANM